MAKAEDDFLTLVSQVRILPRASDEKPCFRRSIAVQAKEAIYKGFFPLARSWLGFEDVELSLSLADGTFHASLLVPGPQANGRSLTELSGRWLAAGDLVFAAVVVPA